MRAINANTVDIATNWLPSVRVLGDLRAGVITYRNVIREHMLGETPRRSRRLKRPCDGVVESNTKIRQQYEAMISSPEERAIYDGCGRRPGTTTRKAPRRSWSCRARMPARSRMTRMT